jgi:transcriptional regulator
MYIPPAFQEEDIDKLVAFMRANSFATLISVQNGVPVASHIPLVVSLQDNIVKLTSQNRSHSDQANVAHALLNSNDPDTQAIGTAMQENIESEG